MSFKIIAIETLEIDEINRESYKKLSPNTLYRFSKDYQIGENSILHTPTFPEDFFKNSSIDINVSAIVGKNGSGKSSLVELFIRIINNLSYAFNINPDIEYIPNIKVHLYFLSDAYYKITILNDDIFIAKQHFGGDAFVAIDQPDFNFEDLFYSIVVNYSLYGLNALEIGPWVNSLFHKNDGYQTPIVINPMRDNGIIDVNSENSLGISRLISNILRPESIMAPFRITDDLVASKIVLKINGNDNPVLYEVKESQPDPTDFQYGKPIVSKIRFSDITVDLDDLLRRVNDRHNFDFPGHWERGKNNLYDLTIVYAIRKLVKIAITYPFYEKYFDKDKRRFKHETLNEFLDLIFKKNQNHISFKLIQALNFLKYRHIADDQLIIEVSNLANTINEIIKGNGLSSDSVIELIPPPIFSTDLILRSIKTKAEVSFNLLSSGEKQLLYSVNSVIYHLINLDSIDNTNIQRAYKYVSIILEEIELYFHPNMQKEFVNFLLLRLSDLSLKNIKAVNIWFITHSPFILSDIPNNNLLLLIDGEPDNRLSELTFGANVYDLLSHDFFMDNGFIGDFAMRKIQVIIDALRRKKRISLKKRKEIKSTIDIVGEPYLKNQLLDLYYEKYPEEFNKDTEIMKLEETIKRLRQ